MLVYDILGKESPVLEGLGVPESMEEAAEEAFHPDELCQASSSKASTQQSTLSGSHPVRPTDSSEQPAPKKKKTGKEEN